LLPDAVLVAVAEAEPEDLGMSVAGNEMISLEAVQNRMRLLHSHCVLSSHLLKPPVQRFLTWVVLTNLHSSIVTNIRKCTQGILRRIATELGNRLARILAAADRRDIRRVIVRVDGAEQAARRGRSDGERRKRKEGRGEEDAGEHVDGCLDWIGMVNKELVTGDRN